MMIRHSTRYPFVAVLALALGVGAVEPATGQEQPRRVTLDEALAMFARNNLELRLARADAGEAEGLARQAAAYPNPVLTGTHEPLSNDGAQYSESYLYLSQRFEWPGTVAARHGAAARRAEVARAEVTADSLRLTFEVKQAYTRASEAELAEAVLERARGVFREGERRAEERLGEGDISLYDVHRIRAERRRYENLHAEAQLASSEARRTLARLALPEGETLELAPADSLSGVPPAIHPQRAFDIALRSRAEIVARERAVDAAEADASLARRERIPNLTAMGGFKRQSDGLTGAFLGLSLPLPFWDRRGGAIDAASARVTASESRLLLTRRLVRNDVEAALSRYRSLQQRTDLLTEAVPSEGGDLLEIAQVAYEEGEMELIGLLDAAEALRQARLNEARLRADLWESYYDLERAVGGFGGSSDDRERDE